MLKLKDHKRGDTFAFITTIKTEELIPHTGISLKLRCQIKNQKDILMATMSISEIDPPGDYLFNVPASVTEKWPLETLFLDIEYTDNNVVTTSETASFKVVKDITTPITGGSEG